MVVVLVRLVAVVMMIKDDDNGHWAGHKTIPNREEFSASVEINTEQENDKNRDSHLKKKLSGIHHLN